MILKINYRAVKMDNCQGGSGQAFFSSIYCVDIEFRTAREIQNLVENKLKYLNGIRADFIENRSLESLELIKQEKYFSNDFEKNII